MAQHIAPTAYLSSDKINHIRTWEAAAPITHADTIQARTFRDVKQTTQYFDGLGRPIQTVIKKGSMVTGDTARDMVSAVVYDEFGREQYKYLPFAANNTGGNSSISDGFIQNESFSAGFGV
ncbi:MAG: hypothetical protein IPI78_02200 [Chitinophagaceae bacterium]|nr:hypothetical protein [Chitinophagaceae bacterium]